MGKHAKIRKARRANAAVLKQLTTGGVTERAMLAHREMLTIGFQRQMALRWEGKNADADPAAVARDAAQLLRDRGIDTTDITVGAAVQGARMAFAAQPSRDAVERAARELGQKRADRPEQ